jgi:simple sugar transport system permease protein
MNPVRKFSSFILPLWGPLAAIVLSFLIGGLFIYATGKDAIEVYGKMFEGTLGNAYGIGQVLFKATPLIFTGLSAAICFRAGLFNIGAEGQMTAGAFCIAWTGFTLTSLPAFILIPLCLIAGAAGGGLWGAIPGYLKAKFGSHEVINTIMMNFIAFALVSWLVNDVFAVPASVHTPEISTEAHLERLDLLIPALKGAPVNISLLIALLCCGIYNFYLRKTKSGYEMKTVGFSKTAAEYGKINVKKVTITAMIMAGGFAGAAGSNFVMGYKHYFELGFSEGAGYLGIAVALLGRNSPVGIILAALFFGVLEYGGLTVNTIVPKELFTILQAIVIILIVVITKFLNRK